MKNIIIVGDGMADHPVERLGGKTPLQYADTPFMDTIARQGRTGKLTTIPEGFPPGSEVANTTILGYDPGNVYEGRGPLEAAGMGYDMEAADMALRCNIITTDDGKIVSHNGGNINSVIAREIISRLNGGINSDRVRFVEGTLCQHLLVIKGGNKHISCFPPHEHIGEQMEKIAVTAEEGLEDRRDVFIDGDGRKHERMTSRQTARLLNETIRKSQDILKDLSHGKERYSIWPWSGGYRPDMPPLSEIHPQIRSGCVISAVNLVRGIGLHAGLDIINVKGATGHADTNYEGKAAAAINALRRYDFVFVHVEAPDEASHEGDLRMKLQAITDIDHRLIAPIYNHIVQSDEPVAIAILPDHPTPVETRIHESEPVPFALYYKGMTPDGVKTFDEASTSNGAYGTMPAKHLMEKMLEAGTDTALRTN